MISLETTRRFRQRIPDGRRAEVAAALRRVQQGFGQPHVHSGLGLRKLGPNLFECRTDRGWRLVFIAAKGLLTFDFAGNHDEVQSYLRRR
jgi:hypothetical protein